MINIEHLMTKEIIERHRKYIINSSFESKLKQYLQVSRKRKLQEKEVELFVKKVNSFSITTGTVYDEIESFLEYIDKNYLRLLRSKNIFSDRNRNLFTCIPSYHEIYKRYIYKKFPLFSKFVMDNENYKKWLHLFDYDSFSASTPNEDLLYNKFKRLSLKVTYNLITKAKSQKNNNWGSIKSFLIVELNKLIAIKSETKQYIEGLIEELDEIDFSKTKIEVISSCTEYFKEKISNWDMSIYSYKILCDLDSWGAYDYLLKLGVTTCPYCNRQYITPIYSKYGRLRADLDHFYSKSKYPYFALSIYNLVPSCKICNSSLKGQDDFSYETHIHPFDSGFKHLKFSYSTNIKHRSLTKNYSIELRAESLKSNNLIAQKEEKNSTKFMLKELYATHQEEFEELIEKRVAYTNNHISDLTKQLNQFSGKKYNSLDIAKMITGVDSNGEEFEKRPLSKFKYDIANQLGYFNSDLDLLSKVDRARLLQMIFDT